MKQLIFLITLLPLYASAQMSAGIGTSSEGFSYVKLAFNRNKNLGFYTAYYPTQIGIQSNKHDPAKSSVLFGTELQYEQIGFNGGAGISRSWLKSNEDNQADKKMNLNLEVGCNFDLIKRKEFGIALEFGYNYIFGVYSGLKMKFLS